MRIALTGNPNSGKTTMFNALTGSNEKVGNWAGVTVDKTQRPIKKIYCTGEEQIIAVDLPGAYSMSPFTNEESVTSEYIKGDNPDAIINIVDATNLSRSLFFTTQLLELGIPMVVALNKSDINKKKETDIDSDALSRLLGCPVVNTISTSSDGLRAVVDAVVVRIGLEQKAPFAQRDIDMNDKEAVAAEDRRRFEFVNRVVAEVETRKIQTKDKNINDKIDAILTNKWLGIPIFAVVMFFVFAISQAGVGPWIAEGIVFNEGLENELAIPGLVTLIDMFKQWVAGMLEGGNDFLVALLTEGMIGGVSAVVGFLPLVMIMYFLIALLEDCGYMARVSVLLDPIFKKVGLSGRSVIPFVVGTGCAVPGVMTCRTIKNERERRATAMLAPFMPCGAKLPVIALFAGAFFSDIPWVGTLMYFVGIIIILVGALLINSITGNSKKKSYFIIEMPEYKMPSFTRAFKSMLDRGWSYVVKAGTVILLCNTIVYIMQSFTWSLTLVGEGEAKSSILAFVAGPVSILLIPIGVKAWQMAAAALTGFIAKENVVGTLAVCYGISNLIDTDELVMVDGASTSVAQVFGITSVAALAYMMFNLFSPPCFAAIGAMGAEMKSTKWLIGGIALQLGVGYTVAYFVYSIGTLITAPATLDIVAAVIGLAVVVIFAGVIVGLILNTNRKLRLEAAIKAERKKKAEAIAG